MRSEIKYRQGIVSFLDILGFETILKTEPAQIVYDLINTFHYNIKKPYEHGTINEKYGKLCSIHVLSDCIFKTVDMTNYHDDVYAALSLLGELSFNIVSQGKLFYQHGKFLRGAITFGKFFSDEGKALLFGPAIARAYTIESNYAFYPRIYIDPCVLEVLHNILLPQYPFGKSDGCVTTGTKDDFLTNFYSWITKGDDGIWFLDYLGNFRLWFPQDENPCLFISRHKSTIEEILNLPNDHLTDSMLLKYLWLANYHNRTIDKWTKYGWAKSLEGFDPEELSVSIPKQWNK